MDSLNQILFDNKSFGDLLKEIHGNQKKKAKQLASLIAEKFSATVDRKENPEGSDSYTGDCDFLTNFLKSKNLDWQITDKKILNLIE